MDTILEITYSDLRKSFVSYTKLFICKDSMGVEGTKTNWNGWEIGLSVVQTLSIKGLTNKQTTFNPQKKKKKFNRSGGRGHPRRRGNFR